ncbi:M61 family metallopeptidase [Foetidibacter luteolus]|uniref:M61 family metallopeptidase n=1 Tax=Foetidibacter luteolus TaxID=2608880 RepID=UPI001A99490A|nr:hypothetical protein [Foetidibacter luteolus]
MRRLSCIIALSIISVNITAQVYRYSADIKNINNDKVSVQLLAPAIKEQEIVYSFPRVIPGSYSEKNYGKYIDDFKALDANGKKLKVNRLNPNQYSISNAAALHSITYQVNDTWDKTDRDFIFQPGGTNIEAGKNVVMNNFAFYGYLEGYKNLPFEVTVTKPAEFYASTHLSVDRSNAETNILKADNYVELADNPVFFSRPDTTSIIAGSTAIQVTVVSATGKVTSSQVAGYIRPMAFALQKFFNGLPVSSYNFLFYFEDPDNPVVGKKDYGGHGALEHNYSSLYFLPEIAYEPQLKSMVNNVSSHEFLHILTPLNLHSREIDDFDFMNPKMSKHLWLYEGVTEYFSDLVQLQNKLVTEEKFLEEIRKKIKQAEKYGSFSMTEMSAKVLTNEYKDKYGSVYNKGALIAFMLDILIREKTNGDKDLKQVVQHLAARYGPGKPFDDETFFDDFIAASHPAAKAFIENYIAGSEPLPYKAYLEKLGYIYEPLKKIDGMIIGSMALKYDEENSSFVFTQVDKDNALGIKNNDAFVAADGVAITSDNIDEVWDTYFSNNISKAEAEFTVRRNGEEKILKGRLYKGYRNKENYLVVNDKPTAEQKKLHEQYVQLN